MPLCLAPNEESDAERRTRQAWGITTSRSISSTRLRFTLRSRQQINLVPAGECTAQPLQIGSQAEQMDE